MLFMAEACLVGIIYVVILEIENMSLFREENNQYSGVLKFSKNIGIVSCTPTFDNIFC